MVVCAIVGLIGIIIWLIRQGSSGVPSRLPRQTWLRPRRVQADTRLIQPSFPLRCNCRRTPPPSGKTRRRTFRWFPLPPRQLRRIVYPWPRLATSPRPRRLPLRSAPVLIPALPSTQPVNIGTVALPPAPPPQTAHFALLVPGVATPLDIALHPSLKYHGINTVMVTDAQKRTFPIDVQPADLGAVRHPNTSPAVAPTQPATQPVILPRLCNR